MPKRQRREAVPPSAIAILPTAANDTIAHKIFGKDDSPLGRDMPVIGKRLNLSRPDMAAHRFTLTYPRYGTINPIPKDASGNDVEPTPTDKALLALYHMPVTGLFEVDPVFGTRGLIG